ncbi:hypothetical protein [Comamonas thiooxydans]|uniref:hypothetical protein n=1 Tax=Comamonas thiooxydans TaxID=363952 RepID=UPI0021148F78|nr:hypothetical protein [Comamonas thiooxydans]UUE95355.1 hypothetical protein MJ608_06865 [Comamonas thiooxydans]
MLTFKSFTGINNVQPEHRLKASDLLAAKDVDIGLDGEVSRRGGYQRMSEVCHKNLWQGAGFHLATTEGSLVSIADDAGTRVLWPNIGPERVWYCNLPDGRTLFSTGLLRGVTDGVTAWPLTVPEPASLGALDFAFGELEQGQYRYGVSHVRLSDRAEGPVRVSEPVSVLQGGLRLDGLPQLPGHALNVYLSGRDGEGMFFAGTTVERSFEFGGRNSELVLPARTLGAQVLPDGTLMAFWRGRVLVAQGKVLWASRPAVPHLSDWRDFKPMTADITALVPVDTGIYVGTSQDLIFLGGETFDGLIYTATKRGPVVLGSGIEAPGHRLALGDGTGAGAAMLCIAGGEVVAGFDGGQTTSLTANRFKTAAKEVSAAFREVSGIPQYMAVPHG